MFTGIVRERGRIASFDGSRLVLEAATEADIGDSVAISGVCLTVVETEPLAFDVVGETLERTTLGRKKSRRRGERRARAPRRRAARRPHRAGPRRRRRLVPRRSRRPDVVRRATRDRPLLRREGLNRSGWGFAHRCSPGRRRLRRRARPAHARGDHARCARARRRRQPRGGRHREVRRAPYDGQ